MKLADALKWTVAAVAVRYILKLAGNLTLARLLAPEAFGQMAIVLALVSGIEAITDVGTKPALIRSHRNDDAWLDTAWTMGLIRGLVVAALILCAAIPAARFFRNDELAPLIAATGLMSVIVSARSISAVLAVRDLAARQLALIELVEILLCYAIMIAWALKSPTAWALVAGTVLSVATYTLLSYRVFTRRKHRLRLDRTVAVELAKFGKWVMFASIVGLLLLQWDRVFVGRSLGLGEVGVYSIAITWAGSLQQLIGIFVSRLYLPIIAKLRRSGSAAGGESSAFRRNILLAILVPFAWIAGSANEIIEILYPRSFIGAGPVLGLLVVAAWFSILEYLYNDQLMLAGQPQRRFQAQIISVVLMIIGVAAISARLSLTAVAAIVAAGTVLRASILLGFHRRHADPAWKGDVRITLLFVALTLTLALGWRTFAVHWTPLTAAAGSFVALAPVGAWLLWRAVRQTAALGDVIYKGEEVASPLSELEPELAPW